jgi:cytochrome b6-f complex iron-sulfur subunit
VPRRRRILRWLGGGFLSLWGFGFLWVVAAFLKPPRARESLADRIIRVGPLDSLPVGHAQLVRHGREPIYVVRTGEDRLIGLSAICTHLRCVLTWDGDRRLLQCPCHDGAFDLNGNVLKGPPPGPLRRHRVETRLGEIFVHL